jgi:hypothetical protein
MVLPAMVLPVTVPPVCEPPVMLPPLRVPPDEPLSKTEELPLLPQPPDSPHTTPPASMQKIVAFPYLMVIPPP